MPIRPENRHHYQGPEWKEVRKAILARAKDACEFCGVENHVRIWRGRWFDGPQEVDVYLDGVDRIRRSDDGGWITTLTRLGDMTMPHPACHGWPEVKIILTIAHLDHDPTNNDPGNLRALCQRCHNRHDAAHRAETRRMSRIAADAPKVEKPLSLSFNLRIPSGSPLCRNKDVCCPFLTAVLGLRNGVSTSRWRCLAYRALGLRLPSIANSETGDAVRLDACIAFERSQEVLP